MTRILFLPGLALATILTLVCTAVAQRSGPSPVAALPPGREAANQYLDGIEALETGEYDRAVGCFTRAVEQDEERAEYHRARGVAHVLAEKFEAAVADLQRGLKLRPGDRESRLWLAAAYRMKGDPATGAQYFTHGYEVPAGYASLVYNDMAMEYWSSLRGSVYDRESQQRISVTEPVKKRFPEVARAYAQRHKGTGRMPAENLLARMKASVERADWAAAMKDLVALRLHSPDDPELRGYLARSLLGLGNACRAREEFTRTLCLQPLWGHGYLGRSEAASHLGDSRRAQADLNTAASLGVNTDRAKAQITQILATNRAPSDAPAQFAKRLTSEMPFESLVEAALWLHRAANNERARYDEAYQDRIWAWSDLIRTAPKDPNYHEALGRFLFNDHVVPRIWNGPRGGGEQLRPQSDGDRLHELHRAIEFSESALKLDKRHANAMATKGWVIYRLGRSAEAEGLADTGLAIERKNVRLLNLKAQILTDTAVVLAAQASALRQGRTETTTERRSDGIYEVRRYHPPTAEQLAQAAALEAQAAACRRQAALLSDERQRVQTEAIPALLKQGDKVLEKGDPSSARRLFEQAYSYDPDGGEAQKRLAEVHRRLGNVKAHRAFLLQVEPMRHTSAAEPLKLAWEHMVRTAWASASDALNRAAEMDPTDARTPAYRSVIASHRSDLPAAAQQRRAALAFEEARTRLMGSSLISSNAAPIDLQETGLNWIVRIEQGHALLKAGQNEKAIEAYAPNLNLEKRFEKDELFELVPSAMLPDPSLDAGAVPEAPSLASLISWSRVGAARAWLALGRSAEAQAEFRAIRAYLGNWPPTAKGRETMNVVEAWARLGEAEAAYGAKDYETAFRLLMGGEGWAWRLPPDLDKHRRALSEKVADARKGEWQTANQSRREAARGNYKTRILENEIRRLKSQRESLQKSINRPGTPPLRQQQFERQLLNVEKMIIEKEAALKATQQPTEPQPDTTPSAR